jgi:1-deoxy-D-xylulose-5-phosphate synthase
MIKSFESHSAGELTPKTLNGDEPPKYQDVFGHTIVELAKKNDKIVGITPAMPTGSSLKFMMQELPDRAFDVGIAEQHAVTLAAGMATQGMIPFCNVYSTFLQRAYDQIIHDVALQNLAVVFCLDRAGLVGQDGATHQGVFDIAYLRCIPNLTVFAPLNELELRNIMYTAQLGLDGPIAIRYPRGKGVTINWKQAFTKIEIGKGQLIKKGSTVAVLSVGHIGNSLKELWEDAFLEEKVAHYDMRFIKPLDEALLHQIFQQFQHIVTLEDGTIKGGFGSAVSEFASENGYINSLKIIGVPDQFIEHGTTDEQYEVAGISPTHIKTIINKILA